MITYKLLIKYAFFAILFAAILCGIFFSVFKRNLYQPSIDKGVEYLQRNQATSGEFGILECKGKELNDCSKISSPFATSFVIYSVGNLKGKVIGDIIKKGLTFLDSSKLNGNVWSYYVSKKDALPVPDLDDTAMASFVLNKGGYSADNREVFDKNKNNDGIYSTWLNLFGSYNDVDCAVNANILMYLQNNDEQICKWMNSQINDGKKCAPYYSNDFMVYYIFSRAYREGVSCLGESKEKIISSVLSKQAEDGSFGGDFENALALNTLLNFKFDGKKKIEAMVETILINQNEDGSWDMGSAWESGGEKPLFYGSKELTTALSLEAINKSKD